MTNLIGKALWSDVRLLESHEYAQGGENGNMNEQAKALVNRTEFLKGLLEQLQQAQQSQQDWQTQFTEQINQLGQQIEQINLKLNPTQPSISCTGATREFKFRTDFGVRTIEASVNGSDWAEVSTFSELSTSLQPVNGGVQMSISMNTHDDTRVKLRSTSDICLFVDPVQDIDEVNQPNKAYTLYDAGGHVIDPRLGANQTYNSRYIDDSNTDQDYVVLFRAVDFCLSAESTDPEQPTDPETPTDPEPVYPASAMVLRSSDQVSEVSLQLVKGTHNIDWGDGTTETNVSGNLIHHYDSLAKHTIIVEKASNEGGSNGNNTMVMVQAYGIEEVVQWCDQGYEVLGFALGSQILQDTLMKVPTTAPLVFNTTFQVFMRCSVFNDASILNWDVSPYTDLNCLFFECHAFNQPIGATWDFSNKELLYSMFYNCQSFNQDLSMINVANAANMDDMFYGCTQFDQDLSEWCVINYQTPITDPMWNNERFAYGSALKPEHYPVWGTCPRGEASGVSA
ncbi:BspA family leucine-rich repeat surface protein [Acinetobacter sp. ANC 4636]